MKHLPVTLVPIAALPLVLALAGCSTIEAERLQEAPQELEGIAGENLDPAVVWSEDGKSWLFLTFGSSSCPNEPREIREIGERTFEVSLESAGGPFCTADIGPAMYRVPAPVSRGQPVTVDLGHGVVVTM